MSADRCRLTMLAEEPPYSPSFSKLQSVRNGTPNYTAEFYEGAFDATAVTLVRSVTTGANTLPGDSDYAMMDADFIYAYNTVAPTQGLAKITRSTGAYAIHFPKPGGVTTAAYTTDDYNRGYTLNETHLFVPASLDGGAVVTLQILKSDMSYVGHLSGYYKLYRGMLVRNLGSSIAFYSASTLAHIKTVSFSGVSFTGPVDLQLTQNEAYLYISGVVPSFQYRAMAFTYNVGAGVYEYTGDYIGSGVGATFAFNAPWLYSDDTDLYVYGFVAPEYGLHTRYKVDSDLSIISSAVVGGSQIKHVAIY